MSFAIYQQDPKRVYTVESLRKFWIHVGMAASEMHDRWTTCYGTYHCAGQFSICQSFAVFSSETEAEAE